MAPQAELFRKLPETVHTGGTQTDNVMVLNHCSNTCSEHVMHGVTSNELCSQLFFHHLLLLTDLNCPAIVEVQIFSIKY